MTEEAIRKIKSIYEPGTRIFLISKSTKPALPRTSKGYVKKVDGDGLLYVNWNNGMQTTLNALVDRFYRLSDEQR